jgi:hypothetical protein
MSSSTWDDIEKDYLAPEIKIANEIICDHVWDKLYPPFL